MPPDVFRPDRYFNAKDYLNASDPNRKTTPVSHKIDKWIQKYGTAETLRFDEFGQRIRRLNGYSMSTWLDPERYLLTDDGRHVVYVAGMFDEAAGAATYWGPGALDIPAKISQFAAIDGMLDLQFPTFGLTAFRL